MGRTRDQPAQFLLAAALGTPSTGGPRVTFRRYGKRLFLAGFKNAAYEVSFPASRHEKSIRLAQEGASAHEEVIDLEPVTGSR